MTRFNLKSIRFIVMALVVSALACGGETAWAQDADDSPAPAAPAEKSSGGSGKKAPGGKKSTSINFEDELVEGQAQKPELFYLLQKKQFNHKRLIRLRDDFLPEMRKTSEDIQGKGSGT